MAQMHRDIKWASIHPGVVNTGLQAGADGASLPVRVLLKVGKPLMMTVEKGAWNQLWASVSSEVKSGEYYEPVGVAGKATEQAKDMWLAEKVGRWTDVELQRFMF